VPLFICFQTGTKAKGDVIQVTWDNVEELEKYIESVKKAAEQLATENRQLRRWHYTICDKVCFYRVLNLRFSVSPMSDNNVKIIDCAITAN
jgi:hypothetical protein